MHDIPTILADPTVQAALADLRATHDRFVDEIVHLTQIPAPPFQEAERAAEMHRLFAAHGLEEVETDAIGNVTGLRRGQGNGGIVAVAAHLDTVFPAGTNVTVRREGTRLCAPGIGDDTRGLATLLALIRALEAGGVATQADLLFVADVGEEGKGDLRGVRHLFAAGPYRDRIGAFFTLDGIETEDLTTAAIGSKRYRAIFRGPGGHSLMAFGTVNPAHAMAEVVTGLSRLIVPADPLTTHCASVFGGGSSVNAIPEEVWMEVDLRSASAPELARLDAQFRALVAAAVAHENARGRTASGAITAELVAIGDRPAGVTDPEARIVTASLAAIRAFGFTPRTSASSTDANLPMSLAIPAVKLSTGGAGGRAHSLDEWIDVAPDLSTRGLSVALAAILGTAGLARG